MKVTTSLMAAALILSGASVFANEHENGPCSPVFKACESAGFVKGENAPKGRDLWDDCKEPLLKGKAVAGVSVDAKDINKCKQFKEDKKHWMEEWKKQHDN